LAASHAPSPVPCAAANRLPPPGAQTHRIHHFATRLPSPLSRLAVQRPLHRHRTRHRVIRVLAPPDPSVAFLPNHHCGNVHIEALQESAVRLPLSPPRRLAAPAYAAPRLTAPPSPSPTPSAPLELQSPSFPCPPPN